MLEPIRGVHLLQSLNTCISSSHVLYNIAAIIADYPIFLLPLFLLRVYIGSGMIRKDRDMKYAALLVLIAAALALIINLGIQHFIDKARPETALIGAGHLVMQHLPTRSFPSDHAAVSMVVAIAALLLGYRSLQKKSLIVWGRILLLGSILMSIARVAVGVHRPTDIFVGWLIGIFSACIICATPLQRLIKTYILTYIVKGEERVMALLGIKS